MPLLGDITGQLDLVPFATQEAPFLAVAYAPDRDGTFVHLGGGMYMGENHNLAYREKPSTASGYLIHSIYSQKNARELNITLQNFYKDDDGQTIDFMTLFAPEGVQNFSAPMIIPSDPSDLIARDVRTAGIPKKFGELFYSDGTVQSASSALIWTSAHVARGMDGGALYVNYEIDNLSQYYIGGALTRGNEMGGGFTAFTPSIYAQIADDMNALGISALDVPTPLLLAGLKADEKYHDLYGTYLNETLHGSHHINRLEGGKGMDTYIGKGGADVFVFATGDAQDVIREFVEGEDIIEIDGQKASGISELKALGFDIQNPYGFTEIHYGDGDVIIIERIYIDQL